MTQSEGRQGSRLLYQSYVSSMLAVFPLKMRGTSSSQLFSCCRIDGLPEVRTFSVQRLSILKDAASKASILSATTARNQALVGSCWPVNVSFRCMVKRSSWPTGRGASSIFTPCQEYKNVGCCLAP